jgi:Astacin (Peptidase family M12A)
MKKSSLLIAIMILITYSCTQDAKREIPDQKESNKNEIHLCTEIDLLNNKTENSRINGAILKSKKWTPGQTISVKFLNGDAYLQKKVKQFACQWMIFANLKLIFVEPWQNADIRINFDDSNDSNSYIGTDCKSIDQNRKTMNFGWFNSNTSDEEFRRTTVHEFGHALGLIHEHQNPSANISWNLNDLYNYYKGRLTPQQVDDNIVKKYNSVQTNYTAYDNLSIMHYEIPASLTTNGYSASWNTSLSNTDKIFIEQMYPGVPDQYLVGDWDGDGKDNIGIRRGNIIILDYNNDDIADFAFSYGFGDYRDTEYLVGDWNGDGKDNIAVRRGNQIIMDYNFDGVADASFVYGFGDSRDSQYLVGDWNGDGKDNIAVRRGNQIIMDFNFDGVSDLDFRFGFGDSRETKYIVGDWNGDLKDNIGVRRGNQIIMDYNFDGVSDLDFRFGFGDSRESEYLVGDWNGDRKDNIALRQTNKIVMDYNFDGILDGIFKIGN